MEVKNPGGIVFDGSLVVKHVITLQILNAPLTLHLAWFSAIAPE